MPETDKKNNNPSEMTIGQRIAYYRKKKGLTQKELSDKVGIERSLITNYEIGRVRIYDDMIIKIAIALNISSDSLLGLKDSISKNDTPSLKIIKRLKRIENLPLNQQKTILRNIDISIAGIEKET